MSNYPLKPSQLKGLATVALTNDYNDLDNKPSAFSGDYNDLTNKPTIPSNTSELTNDSGFITISDINYPVSSVNGQTGAVIITKSSLSLGNVDNTSDLNKPISTATQSALDLKLNSADKNQANGVAGLDNTGKIPSSLLPSYVDDVLEYPSYGDFPSIGESGKIYVDIFTGKIYRWSGTTYLEISASPGSSDSIAEGSVNLYFTEARVRSTVLTGLSTAINSSILSSDSILIALGKLQSQINNLSDVAFSNDYNDLSNKPSKLSDFTNDLNLVNNTQSIINAIIFG